MFGSCLGLGVGGDRGQLWERGEVALSVVPQAWPLSRGDHTVGGGDLRTVLLFWPGAFLSIFMECKRSFCFILFFCKA